MKRKKVGNLLSELNFTSSLELEQSVDIITTLAHHYPVTLTERNADRIDFDIKFQHGTVKGTLQRWRGNETRITCSGDVVRMIASSSDDSNYVPTTLIVGGTVCMMLLSAGQVIPALIGAGVVFAFVAKQPATSIKNEPETIPIFRERDAIFQYLIDNFKASGEVSPL